MTAPIDAPAATTPLSSELRYQGTQARVEVRVAEAIAGERGIRGEHTCATGCRERGTLAPRQHPPQDAAPTDQSSHKCIHIVIQLYHTNWRARNPGEGLIIGSYRFNLGLAILLDPK